MSQKKFFILLIFITLCGFFLRLNKYDRIPPFGETKDEFIYPWAGMSLLQTGIPTSWSPFISYPTKFQEKYWGESFPMVTPFLEKPFLYPLLSGAWILLNGITEFGKVRLEILRLLPIGLSMVSIFVLGLYIREILEEKIALLASIIYATTPTIALGNRLSLTENLLIPISLFGLWIVVKIQNKHQPWLIHLLGVISGLAIHTKQIGISLPLSFIIIFMLQKQWRSVMIISIYSGMFFLLSLAVPLIYGWETFFQVTGELRRAHALGLPEAIFTLFRFPGIGHKESIFLDGTMLAGWIFLFASPFWLFNKRTNKQSNSSHAKSETINQYNNQSTHNYSAS